MKISLNLGIFENWYISLGGHYIKQTFGKISKSIADMTKVSNKVPSEKSATFLQLKLSAIFIDIIIIKNLWLIN